MSTSVQEARFGVMATDNQYEVEKLALELLATARVQEGKDELRRRMLADPLMGTVDGQASMERALDEIAYMICLGTVNMDFRRPKVLWYFTAPRYWMGHFVPGTRWAMDNPDNVYRHVMIEEESSYEIRVKNRGVPPTQYHYAIFDSYTGEDTTQTSDLLDQPMAALLDSHIEIASDGSYTVIVDNQPADGRRNHMQSAPGAKVFMIRHTLTDWAEQLVPEIEVVRTGGPEPEPVRTMDEMAAQAAAMFTTAGGILFRFKNNYYASMAPNTLSEPWLRGGGFASSAHGRFELGDGEALVVTLDPLGARGLGFCAGDPWMVSCEHITSTGSLNDRQAEPNPDGSYTFVTCPDDPGLVNWVDSEGFHDGTLLLRWLDLPKGLASMDGAVREVKVVKLADLEAALPAPMRRISPAERRAMCARRAVEYARRYTS